MTDRSTDPARSEGWRAELSSLRLGLIVPVLVAGYLALAAVSGDMPFLLPLAGALLIATASARAVAGTTLSWGQRVRGVLKSGELVSVIGLGVASFVGWANQTGFSVEPREAYGLGEALLAYGGTVYAAVALVDMAGRSADLSADRMRERAAIPTGGSTTSAIVSLVLTVVVFGLLCLLATY